MLDQLFDTHRARFGCGDVEDLSEIPDPYTEDEESDWHSAEMHFGVYLGRVAFDPRQSGTRLKTWPESLDFFIHNGRDARDGTD